MKSEFSINPSSQQICDEINMLIEDKYKYEIALKGGVLVFLEQNSNHKLLIKQAFIQ